MNPSFLVWCAHGSPAYDCELHEGRCWMCAGLMSRGMPVDKFNGASFTGQNKVRLPNATHVCEPCIFVCSRIAPVLGRPAKEGKKFGGSFRNYSHLWEEGWESPAFARDESGSPLGPAGLGYVNASKGEKPAIRAFLSRHHEGAWFAAIADSGQKHVIPWAPMNHSGRGGRVLFDEQVVHVPGDQTLIDDMTALLTAGATKEEIGRGDFGPRAWQLAPELLARFEARHAGARHSSWFALALWLAQRDEDAVKARLEEEKRTKDAGRKAKRKASDTDRGGVASSAKRSPRKPVCEPAKTLGHDPGEDAKRSANKRDSRGVGDGSGAKAPVAKPQQLGLFSRG